MKSFMLLVVFLAAAVLPLDRVFDWNKGCGERSLVGPPGGSRFLGGQYAMKGALPWQVSIQMDGQPIGGATILSRHFVLTSSKHASSQLTSREHYRVVAGLISLSEPGAHAQIRYITKATVHPDYNSENAVHDIMLLQLDCPWDFNGYVQPICIPFQESEEVSLNFTHCFISGWLRIYLDDSVFMDKLRDAEVDLIDKPACELNFVPNMITEDVICVQLKATLNDSSQSDIGGPLQCYSDQRRRFYQLGVSSYHSLWFGRPYSPGIYARVSRYSVWINETVSPVEMKSGGSVSSTNLVLVLLSAVLMLLEI